MKFTILVDPSLVIITTYLVCLIMPGSREDFLRKTSFSTFYPKTTTPLGGGHEIYNFLSPYPTDATYQILVNIGSVVLHQKMLTKDGRQLIAIGHLSDSGDLIKNQYDE